MFGSRRLPLDRRSEKPNFVQTCNLLSRFLKEKGSLRDLNLEIGGKVESLETIVKNGSTHYASAVDKGKSVQESNERYSSIAIDSSIKTVEDTLHKITSNKVAAMDPKNSQLTIFYSGRMLVFDDCPADKAKELLAFAKQQSSRMSCAILSNTLGEKPSCGPTVTSSPRDMLPPRPKPSMSSQKPVSISLNTCKTKIDTRITPQPEAKESDSPIPIARRSSLNRFLEKRKDRAVVRGPYHDRIQERPASSSKGDEQLELRL